MKLCVFILEKDFQNIAASFKMLCTKTHSENALIKLGTPRQRLHLYILTDQRTLKCLCSNH